MSPLSIFLLGLAFTAVLWAIRSLVKESDYVHDTLRDFRAKAEAAQSRLELINLKADLKTWATKHCWHRTYTSHAQNVLDFMNGRLHSFPHEQNR